MKTLILFNRIMRTLLVAVLAFGVSFSAESQVIRSYNLVYSNNLKGGHTAFGNTSLTIKNSSGVVQTSQVNDFGSYSNGTTSQYGNDNSNMQYVDIDGGSVATAIINTGDNWDYSTAASKPSGWPNVTTLSGASAPSPLGFGPTGTVATTLTYLRTYYFTRTVNFDPTQYDSISFSITIDDGAVVYVNGTEVGRYNMSSGTPSYTTNASSNVDPEQASTITVPAGAPFVNGNNTIQVEVHTSANNESGTDDLFFDLKMSGISSTFNSSSADLILPSTGTNTIKFARLYWGGRISSGDGGDNNINLRTIRIRKGTSGAYTTAVAPTAQVDKALASSSLTDSVYQSYVDVTSFLASGGSGTYTVANVAAATGSRGSGGYYGGWSIVVVYENPTTSYSSVRVYDGYLQVYSGGSVVNQSITLSGFNAPSTPLDSSDAYMTTVAWEGDANLAASTANPLGDYVKINGNIVSNAVNPAVNFWNGTISKNGAFVTSKNPDYKNQMGIDIDEQNVGVGYGITSNATTVVAEFGTEADQYFPSVFAFTMKTKDPNITIEKAVSDALAPYNILQVNEDLTYTLTGSNVGVGAAYNCTIVDTIPSNVTYVPGTLEIVSSPGSSMVGVKTDASGDDVAFQGVNGSKNYVKFFIGTGATSSAGGILLPGESYSVRFKVRTPSVVSQISTVINTARITGQALSGDNFVDDATAIIGPEGGPLSVKMTSFLALKESGNIVLKWITASETKNDRFDIEQSTDGINFSTIGSVKGKGTTSLTNTYEYSTLAASGVKVLYFRLKVYDQDQNITFTKVVSVNLSGVTAIKNFAVYPNPFVNNIKMQIQSDKDEDVVVRILNINGQVLIQRNVNLQPGSNIVVLKDLDMLPKGIHTLEVTSATGKMTQQVIK